MNSDDDDDEFDSMLDSLDSRAESIDPANRGAIEDIWQELTQPRIL